MVSANSNRELGILYVVATPIGHLSDISHRACRILSEVNMVLCEDTRQTAKLLTAYGIDVPTRAFHEHNEQQMQGWVIGQLLDGRKIALVSDAGTPLISDPGFALVREARKQGLNVSPLPGPNAAVAALSVSGLPTNRFCFEGFLPTRSAQRCNALRILKNETRTLIFYESGHRIEGCLHDMMEILGSNRKAAVCREMTKVHETFITGTLADALHFTRSEPHQRKGEFVVVVDGNHHVDLEWERACSLFDRLQTVLSSSKASRIVADTFSVSRNRLYRRNLIRSQD